MIRTLFILSMGLLLTSCAKSRLKKQADEIEEYLANKNLTAEKTEEGVYYLIETTGNGESPVVSDQVTLHYRGYTLDDRVFDSSYERNEPSTFFLTDVIQGWQIGVPMFKEGGKGKLFIPSEYAYGSDPPASNIIGKHEVLIFDIELISVNK